ncbi:hypothetical protein NE237_030683 [Protea cynaroides]|uniref:Uncharacterized protein n=1 Tax=Protea cynaroides TaxID=273540 RepID=A0A9Q0JUI4_9MAGN|nr:hypothetical protein NE237_028839 [Protea cynaroides]KAJ4953851.1 hypothetical protein NE237_030683 [Protea cynaroides]
MGHYCPVQPAHSILHVEDASTVPSINPIVIRREDLQKSFPMHVADPMVMEALLHSITGCHSMARISLRSGNVREYNRMRNKPVSFVSPRNYLTAGHTEGDGADIQQCNAGRKRRR